MGKQWSLALVSLLLFSGCFTPYTQSPVATNFAKEEQKKLRAARHWQVIAHDFAKDLELNGKRIYMALPGKSSEFERGLYKALMSELVRKGAYLVPSSKSAYDAVLKLTTQLDYFHRNLDKPQRSGVLAGLGSGVYLLRNANGGQIAAASVVAVEGWNYFNSKYDTTPHYELIVHAKLYSQERIIDSVTRVYYILDADASLYKRPAPKPPMPSIELEG